MADDQEVQIDREQFARARRARLTVEAARAAEDADLIVQLDAALGTLSEQHIAIVAERDRYRADLEDAQARLVVVTAQRGDLQRELDESPARPGKGSASKPPAT